MDIRKTSPDEYVAWLRSQGVPEEQILGRVSHDLLRALRKQLDETGVPEGFEEFKGKLDTCLAEDAISRTQI